MYPLVNRFLYQRYAKSIINDFESRVKVEDDSLAWLYELMVEYNVELYENGQENLSDPFYYNQVTFSLKQFGFDEEMIGFIIIPRMNIELPIFLGANDANMRRGAAHLTHTSLPVGGKNTNSVIAAHRGMSRATMFRNIERLEIGDEIIITNFHQTLSYEVIETKIINPTDFDEILIRSDRDLITLLTCHPYRHSHQRYLVFAERV